MCWHSRGFSPAYRLSGREQESERERGGSRGTVNNKLIKTHNRHQRLRDRENESREKHSNKEMEAEKYAAGGKKVPKSVGDLHGVPRLNVNPSKGL